MTPVDEALSALAALGELDSADLEPLVAVMSSLEASTAPNAAAVTSLSVGCAFALGERCAEALCAAADAPAEVAKRFFRLRDLLRLHEELRGRGRAH